MENKLLKAIMVMEDGTQKEFEGAGIVAYAITDYGEGTAASGGGLSVSSTITAYPR